MKNIPTYRAKKIDSDEYVVGDLFQHDGHYTIIEDFNKGYTDNGSDIYFGDPEYVDPSTLAINFPDMLDSDNNPIFASLSECGKGGDKFNKTMNGYSYPSLEKGTAIMINGNTYIRYSENDKELLYSLIKSIGRVNKATLKIIGVQK